MEPAWSGSGAMTGKEQDHGTMSSPREDGRHGTETDEEYDGKGIIFPIGDEFMPNLRHISSPREDRYGTEIEEDCREGDDIVTKRQRVEDEEEQVDGGLKEFRRFWEKNMSPHFGPLTATTDFGPMRYTDSGPPRFGGIPYDALEIFSIRARSFWYGLMPGIIPPINTEGKKPMVPPGILPATVPGENERGLKVTELKGLEWPIRVFGLVAVRDSMDHKRNVLFDRSEENCQTLTEKDSSLVLTGPTRAIALIDHPEFEVELRVPGSRPSGGKILSDVYFEYTNRNSASTGLVQTWTETSKRSTIEVKCSKLNAPLEATIELCHSEGSVDVHGQFYAHMEHMGEEHIVLLDSRDDKVTFMPDGHVLLSRKVVLVQEGAKLVLGVKAWQNGDVDSAVMDTAVFPVRFHSRSNGCFDVGFCKMSISVAWSVLC